MSERSRTQPSRMPEKVSDSDRTALNQLLDSSLLGHVGFATEAGQPFVLPNNTDYMGNNEK